MLKVEYLSPGELRPYSGNAKLHPAEQVEQIKNSITEFGFNDPVAIWGENEVVEGHGRLVAALELGLESIPVIRLDDLTEEQRRAYALVHNKLTMNSGFDADLLEIELEGISEFNMEDYGFEPVEAEDLSGGPGSGTGSGFNYSEQYGVIVICDGEEEQEQVYNKLTGGGYNCRVVAV